MPCQFFIDAYASHIRARRLTALAFMTCCREALGFALCALELQDLAMPKRAQATKTAADSQALRTWIPISCTALLSGIMNFMKTGLVLSAKCLTIFFVVFASASLFQDESDVLLPHSEKQKCTCRQLPKRPSTQTDRFSMRVWKSS